jgi:hypothetical protein
MHELDEDEARAVLETARERLEDAGILLQAEYPAMCPSFLVRAVTWAAITLAMGEGMGKAEIHRMAEGISEPQEQDCPGPHCGDES